MGYTYLHVCIPIRLSEATQPENPKLINDDVIFNPYFIIHLLIKLIASKVEQPIYEINLFPWTYTKCSLIHVSHHVQ